MFESTARQPPMSCIWDICKVSIPQSNNMLKWESNSSEIEGRRGIAQFATPSMIYHGRGRDVDVAGRSGH
jgi:hypothetical protein